MYYKILSGGDTWYSKEIIKAYLRCGDDAVQRKLIDGSLKSCQILDRIVYNIPGADESELDKAFSPVVQDLDSVLKTFLNVPTGGQIELAQFDLNEPIQEYSGCRFVRFSAVRCKSKYRDQHRLPVLEVCGVKYVALDCFKAGESFLVQ